MGGDNAPAEVVRGAVNAHRQGTPVVLVGRRAQIEAELAKFDAQLPVVEAHSVIGMEEHVSRSWLEIDSSLLVAARLVESGDAHAVVSCGNSAAIMAIAKQVWGPMQGIDRPAFGGFLPARQDGGVFVLDIGANPVVKATNLIQFAVMGEVYVHLSRGAPAPRVALLSNGSEDSKGTKVVKEANLALRKLDLNFVGNVEGNHVFDGTVDVVVCDGFAGNVLLKGAEGVATEIFELLRSEISKDFVARVAAAAMMPALTRIKRRVDYEEYGGAPVLGVNNIMINCHGRSKAKAVTNAILLAEHMSEEKLVVRIGQALREDEVEVGRRRRLARALHLRQTP
jgi:glycerol-3-phosphate acyltransferase PlsX